MLRVERAALHGSGLMGNPDRDMDESLKRQEREAIEAALRVFGARVCGPRGAARDLGCRLRLDLRIKRLGIDKLQYRSIQKQSARLGSVPRPPLQPSFRPLRGLSFLR